MLRVHALELLLKRSDLLLDVEEAKQILPLLELLALLLQRGVLFRLLLLLLRRL